MMSLHTMPVDKIGYEDILAFCKAHHRESQILDYKRDWSEHLERTMAAFANTTGGLILLGVAEEDKTGYPKLPLEGVELGSGEDEIKRRVSSIAYDGVYPPLFPEIAVARITRRRGRGVVFVRVHQSHQVPHATDDRRRIYVRVESQNRFEDDLANLDQLGWIWDRRRESEQLRKDMLTRAGQIATALMSKQVLDTSVASAALELFSVPYLPGLPCLELASLLQFARARQVNSKSQYYGNCFPLGLQVRPIVDGVLRFGAETDLNSCTQLNKWGMVYGQLRMVAEQTDRRGQQIPPYILVGRLLAHFDAFLGYLRQFYGHFGLLDAGLFEIGVLLHTQGGRRS